MAIDQKENGRREIISGSRPSAWAQISTQKRVTIFDALPR